MRKREGWIERATKRKTERKNRWEREKESRRERGERKK